MRKAFNFYNSYYQIAMELSDKDRLLFYDALLYFQFTGDNSKLEDLKGMGKFAYVSQKHSINEQINGYINKMKSMKKVAFDDPNEEGAQGGAQGGSVQEKEKVQVQEKEKEQEKENLPIKSFKQWSLEDFQNQIKLHKESTTLDKNDLLAFYDYWRELTPTGKMKFQIGKTWQTDLRLKKWERGKNTFAKTETKPETSFKSNNKAL
jgi:hypothetical protein